MQEFERQSVVGKIHLLRTFLGGAFDVKSDITPLERLIHVYHPLSKREWRFRGDSPMSQMICEVLQYYVGELDVCQKQKSTP
jgi:hypothetical protein